MPTPETRNQLPTNPESIATERGILPLPDPFVLENGQPLHGATLAWQCVGPADAPLIIVLGGISAHRHCEGWWEAQCGTGAALGTERYRLLAIDWLGGCDNSTGPQSGETFPA